MSAKDTIDLRALQSGDVQAFRQLVRLYGPTIRAWIGQHVRDPQVIDDLAQETLIAAWDALGDYRGESGVSGWLIGIARNRLRNHYRSTRRRSSAFQRYHEELITLLSGSSPEPCEEKLSALRKCIEKLPDRSHEIVRARYDGGESIAEVADRFEMEINAVNQLLHRCRKNLRSCVQQEVAW
jgi:RNA polymerase sigma-70 factor (ECF subfamily)